MTTISPPHLLNRADRALALALNLADTETRLQALMAGQVDAIVDPSGRTYLLRAAQEHLRESEQRLQTVLESTADVIMVVNRAGVILSLNRAVRRVVGYERGELVGSALFDLVHGEDLTQVYSAFFNIVEEFIEHATVLFRHRTRDGAYRHLEAVVGKLRDASSASVVLSLRPSRDSMSGCEMERDIPPLTPKLPPSAVIASINKALANSPQKSTTPL